MVAGIEYVFLSRKGKLEVIELRRLAVGQGSGSEAGTVDCRFGLLRQYGDSDLVVWGIFPEAHSPIVKQVTHHYLV